MVLVSDKKLEKLKMFELFLDHHRSKNRLDLS